MDARLGRFRQIQKNYSNMEQTNGKVRLSSVIEWSVAAALFSLKYANTFSPSAMPLVRSNSAQGQRVVDKPRHQKDHFRGKEEAFLRSPGDIL